MTKKRENMKSIAYFSSSFDTIKKRLELDKEL